MALRILSLGLLLALVAADTKFVDYVRQNYEANINEELVKQIQRELIASYTYQAYSSFFGRADIALPGFKKFFSEASTEEREHAQKLIDYVNQRGGHAQFSETDIATACDAMADVSILSGTRSRACICEFLRTKSSNECGPSFDGQYGLQAMEDALALERFVNQKLLDLHGLADTAGDAHLTHVLEHEFLEEQVSSIRELAGFVTRLRSFKTNYALGEYMFDQKLQ
ncbi:yolk ferritin-like [Pomacea canaliculata]|uniref:yolk ferritin-like n=1 Tax=Pomacea canaliculata TaxID=400727 RepID=UPI000D726BF4|nr:yolk ferritin-like [Pomacea canaliculata]